MSITYNRDAVATTIHKLSETSDAVLFINKSEHTNGTPSTLEMKRKLPSQNGTVQRNFITRKLGKLVDVGTENERVVVGYVRVEIGKPIGFEDTDVAIMLDDVEGIRDLAEFSDFIQFGLLPEA